MSSKAYSSSILRISGCQTLRASISMTHSRQSNDATGCCVDAWTFRANHSKIWLQGHPDRGMGKTHLPSPWLVRRSYWLDFLHLVIHWYNAASSNGKATKWCLLTIRFSLVSSRWRSSFDLLSIFETVACINLIPCALAKHFTNPACIIAGRLCFWQQIECDAHWWGSIH